MVKSGEQHCDKTLVINNMQKTLDSLQEGHMKTVEELGHWRFFKRLFFVIIGLGVTAIISAAVTVPSFIYDISMKAEVMSYNLKELKSDNNKLSEEVNAVKELQEKELKENKTDKSLNKIKEAVKETIIEMDKKKKRRKR